LLEKGVGGAMWAVHGGGFYNPQKYMVAPKKIHTHLHWFYWESYTTWLTGFALFSVSYTLKFHSKNELGKDYVVPPLEGLWWSDNFDDFRARRKNKWSWTMMIMVPDWLGKKEFTKAVSTVRSNKPDIKVEGLRLESLNEGLSVQIMHIGSYDDETPTLVKLHDQWLPTNGFKETLKHHEIYIGDPRKTPAAKLKTVLRQPVRKR